MNTKKEDDMTANDEIVAGAIGRCYSMFDSVCNYALDIITDVIYNKPCTEAKEFLISRPEELAVRAFRKAIDDFETCAKARKVVH
jgi:hypothetical protein